MKKEMKQLMIEYMKLPYLKVLNHCFEINESVLAGYVESILKGQSISVINLPYSEDDFCKLDNIYKDLPNSHQKELLGRYIYLTRMMISVILEYLVDKEKR